MTTTIHAVYENGVFRPTDKVDLTDLCEVDVNVRPVGAGPRKPSLDDVYAILGRRHAIGEHDVAARHDEHQPWKGTVIMPNKPWAVQGRTILLDQPLGLPPDKRCM